MVHLAVGMIKFFSEKGGRWVVVIGKAYVNKKRSQVLKTHVEKKDGGGQL